jgi:formylglycine-generating enzyme required for sulfatase activity
MFTRGIAIAGLILFSSLTAAAQHHTADTDNDGLLELGELLRVIQFFNSDGFHCEPGTEDGFAVGVGGQTCAIHDSDYNTQDWHVNVSELLRSVQFFNSSGYRTECGTEDDFAPGSGSFFNCGAEGEGELETWTILLPGDVPLEMAWIRPGSFMMGSLETEQDRAAHEGPQHAVELSKGFWMGQYELTQAQWMAVMAGANPSNFQGGELGNTDNRPVEQVSWNDITQAFLPALNTATGQTFRLPSEAEWEFAARAGSTARFYWGDDPAYSQIGTYAWYFGNSDGQTHDVGTAGEFGHPNAFGLYDMSGNVAEWVQDAYHEDYTGAPADGRPWATPESTSRVYRGGSWADEGGICRSASRNESPSDSLGHTVGFRVIIAQIEAPVFLGAANAFAILAGSTVSNIGPSIVTGDLGVSPGEAVVGFPPGILNGAIFTGVGSAAGQAKIDLTTAFNEAAGRSGVPISLPGDLSGLTLYPGLYTNSTSVMLSAGNLTIDALGDSHAVFIFQMGSTLTTGSNTEVVLSGGAKANNIYWQVGTSATLGTDSIFKGNILAEASITLTTGTTVEGRALTKTAAVTLDASVVTTPDP